MKKTAARIAALTLAASLMPTAAWAISVTSYHGVGSQNRAASYNNGAEVSGTLRSVQGYPVYYEGRVNTSGFGCTDPNIGRYSSNTTSTSSVTRGGVISTFLGSCSLDGVSSRISRDINNAPDPSGEWSSNY